MSKEATDEAAGVLRMLAKGHKEFALAEIPSNEEAALALRGKYADLPAVQTREGYEAHRVAIGELVKVRIAIEKRRKELKADSLDYGRRIDAFAKHWTAVIEAIESPLREQKAIIDDAAEKKRLAAVEADRLKQEAEARAKLAEEEAKRKAERDAEDERLRIATDQLMAERAKLNAERNRIAAEQKAAQDELLAERAEIARQHQLVAQEQEKIAQAQRAEQAKIEAERRRIEREDFERQAKIKAEQEARERVERERIEAEQRKAASERADKEEAERIEAMRSDAQHVHAYAKHFAGFPRPPVVKSAEAKAALREAYDSVIATGGRLMGFRAAKKNARPS
jgi:hypothetical protein